MTYSARSLLVALGVLPLACSTLLGVGDLPPPRDDAGTSGGDSASADGEAPGDAQPTDTAESEGANDVDVPHGDGGGGDPCDSGTQCAGNCCCSLSSACDLRRDCNFNGGTCN